MLQAEPNRSGQFACLCCGSGADEDNYLVVSGAGFGFRTVLMHDQVRSWRASVEPWNEYGGLVRALLDSWSEDTVLCRSVSA